MCVVALILGMLLANMLKSICGCKVVEGQGLPPAGGDVTTIDGNNGVAMVSLQNLNPLCCDPKLTVFDNNNRKFDYSKDEGVPLREPTTTQMNICPRITSETLTSLCGLGFAERWSTGMLHQYWTDPVVLPDYLLKYGHLDSEDVRHHEEVVSSR